MRNYANNSPEAMACVLTALMAVDERIEDAEIEALATLDACRRIGISPAGFADVLRAYFRDLEADGQGRSMGVGLMPLSESAVYTTVVDAVTDPKSRMTLWELMIGLANADGELCPAEYGLLTLVAARWWSGDLPARLQRIDPPHRAPPAAVHWAARAGDRRQAVAVA
jgi:uncharacterized tellurite resistance protein B-like protein